MPHFSRVTLFALFTSALLRGPADAAVVGLGTFKLDLQGDQNDNQICQFFTFDNATYDVFGTDVNLSTAFGAGVLCTGSTVGGVGQPTICTSYPNTSIFSTTPSATDSLCLDPGNPMPCFHTSWISVGTATGSFPTSLGGLVYSADGEQNFSGPVGSTDIPGCTLTGTVYRFVGDVSLNAFESATTGVGPDQLVSFDDVTFYNPVTNAPESVDVGISFSDVSGAGQTTVTALSTSSETVPANFAISGSGYQTTFLDISTTASVTPPIEICTSYADANDDGDVDGTSPAIPEEALSILHGEGGTFVDRTTSRNPVTNTICATVDSLSPFAVMIRTTGLCDAENAPCDDGNACTTVDTCNASLECVGGGPEPDCDDGSPCTEDVCVAPAGCSHPPALAASCNASNTKGLLQVKNDATDSKDSMKFQWGGGSIPLADLGTPASTTGYTVCASDADKVLAQASIPAAGTCGTAACWTESDKGVKYADKTKPGTNDGVSQLSGTASTLGKSKLKLKIAGETMQPIQLGSISYPVTVQVITSAGECWEQAFSSTDEKSNDITSLKLLHKAP